MSVVDHTQRQELHALLDDLLDRRNALVVAKSMPPKVFRRVISSPIRVDPSLGKAMVEAVSSSALRNDAISLAAKLLGPTVLRAALPKAAEGSASAERVALIRLLESFSKLIPEPTTIMPWRRDGLQRWIRAIRALEVGDVAPVFRANAGQNRRRGSYELKLHRMIAVLWLEHKIRSGMQKSQARAEVGAAYGGSGQMIYNWSHETPRELGAEVDNWRQKSLVLPPEAIAWIVLGDPDAVGPLDKSGARYRELVKGQSSNRKRV